MRYAQNDNPRLEELAIHCHDKTRKLDKENRHNKRERDFTRIDPIVISTLIYSRRLSHDLFLS